MRAALFLLLVACTREGDSPADAEANVLGNGMRLREVQSPPPDGGVSSMLANANVKITTVVVTTVDDFDETHDGKSRGGITVADVDKQDPVLGLGGISLFAPQFSPANLRLAPGDVVDLDGTYLEQKTIGPTVNFDPAFLPQMGQPLTTFRFEGAVPKPVTINLDDLNLFDNGRKWIGMLVRVDNVTMTTGPHEDTKKTGRLTADMNNINGGPQMSNELYDMKITEFPAGQKFASVTGIVTYFFNLKIAPRSAADLVK